MLTFRQKIFLGYLSAFILFLALMYPFATRTVQKIVINSMKHRADELIVKLQESRDKASLVARLKQETYSLFFRASIVNDELVVIADTHGANDQVNDPVGSHVDTAEVKEAFREGVGYRVGESEMFAGQTFVYIAKQFVFQGEPYVLLVSFPHRYVVELTKDFELGASALAALMLLLFSMITWFIINHITRPIQEIITAVRPYQEEALTILPEIKLIATSPNDEFGRLAETLNSLSSKIQDHIDTLTFERNEKESVLESLVEGVVALSHDMTVTFANSTALRFLGLSRDELVGANFEVAGEPKCYALAAQALREERIVTDTYEARKGLKKQFIDLVASPVRYRSGAILVLQDKTSHYKLLEMRKDFIANASHELKTPITIIRGFAETLHDNNNLGEDVVRSITDKIVRNCIKMTGLIKDLLILTDVENLPQSRLAELDLVPLLEQCIRDVQAVFPDADITLDHDRQESYALVGDPTLLELAFGNIIENGAKYSEGPAKIKVALFKRADDIVTTIADQGVGIPGEALDHIFHRFYRVEGTRQKAGGSGLGLSIVEMIIEKHFGKVSVSSEVGKGSVFTVQLPITQMGFIG